MFDFSTTAGILLTAGYLVFALLMIRIGNGIANLYLLVTTRRSEFDAVGCGFLLLIGFCYFVNYVHAHGFTVIAMAAGHLLCVVLGVAIALARYNSITRMRENTTLGPFLTRDQLKFFDAVRDKLARNVVETALLYGRSNIEDRQTEALLVHQLSKVACHIDGKENLRIQSALDYLNSYAHRLNAIRERIGASPIGEHYTHL